MTAAGRYRASLYALLAPYLLGVAVLVAIPVALTVGLSFTAYDGLSAPTWRGLGNFREVLDDPLFRLILMRGIAWSANKDVYRFDQLATDPTKTLPPK